VLEIGPAVEKKGKREKIAWEKMVARQHKIILPILTIYFENKPLHIENKPLHVENKPLHVENKPLYIENKPLYIENKPCGIKQRKGTGVKAKDDCPCATI